MADRPVVPPPPHRRWELVISIGADEWADLASEVERVSAHVVEHGPACTSISGGPSQNHIVDIREEPEMTHDRYFAELNAHLTAQREAERG